MRRYLRLGFELTLGAPAWIVPGFTIHEEHDAGEGVTFYAFGSVLNVHTSFKRSW